ncbi:MAG: hypothetical protein ACI93R_003565 [Flavobacteriales bacterium]|jgi:hypothetical protein
MKNTNKNKFSIVKLGSVLILTLCAQLCIAQTYYPPSNQLRGGEVQSFATHTYGKVEVRMFSQDVTGTTSTFFWWKDGGQDCGNQWNEIDIELIPSKDSYQSNPIWQTSDGDCEIETWEALHGDAGLYGRWVDYTLEWSPDHIAWYHDGQLDRWIVENDSKLAVNYIEHAMKYAFNLWTQGAANPAWLGNLDFDRLQNEPVYQFVDYFRYYEWNGSGFNANPTKTIDFNNTDDLHNNFAVSNWEFGQSMGYLSWSPDAVGVVDLGNNNGALWLGMFHADQERAPTGGEIPGVITDPPQPPQPPQPPTEGITIQAESAQNFSNLQIAGDQIGFIENGAWASYAAVNIPTAGQYQVTYQVASAGDGGSIQLEQGGGGTIYGNVTVPVTGGWTNWTPISHTVTLPAGNLSFGLVFADGGFNLESFTIAPLEQPNTQTIEVQAEATTLSTGLIVDGTGLGYIENGAWARYPVVNIVSAGNYVISYQIASENSNGVIQFELAGGATVYGSVNIPSTGGWANWTPVSHTVNLLAGDLDYALAFPTGGFNIESFTVTPAQ